MVQDRELGRCRLVRSWLRRIWIYVINRSSLQLFNKVLVAIIDLFQVNYILSKECNTTDEFNDIASCSWERSALISCSKQACPWEKLCPLSWSLNNSSWRETGHRTTTWCVATFCPVCVLTDTFKKVVGHRMTKTKTLLHQLNRAIRSTTAHVEAVSAKMKSTQRTHTVYIHIACHLKNLHKFNFLVNMTINNDIQWKKYGLYTVCSFLPTIELANLFPSSPPSLQTYNYWWWMMNHWKNSLTNL